MQINTESEGALPVGGAELSGQPGQHPRKDIASAGRGHARVPCGIDEDAPVWCGHNRMKAFQHDESVPARRGLQGDLEAGGLDLSSPAPPKPCPLSPVWR